MSENIQQEDIDQGQKVHWEEKIKTADHGELFSGEH